MITMSGLSCLVCDANLNVSSCANIFYTSLPRSGEPLVSFVLRVLRVTLADLRGSYVCTQCYNLFEMLEQAQKTVASIRCEILKAYRGNGTTKVNAADSILSNTVSGQRSIQQAKNDHSDSHWLKQIEDLAPVNIDKPDRVDDEMLSFGLDDFPANANNEVKNIESSNRNLEKGIIEKKNEIDVKQERPEKPVFIDEIFNDSAADENKEYITNNVQAEEELRNPRRCKLCGKLFLSSNERGDARLSKRSSRVSQCEKCKEKFRSISVRSADAIRVDSEGMNSESAIANSIESETKSVTEAKPIFSKKRSQEQGTSESFDFGWSIPDTKGDESAKHKEADQPATFREGKPSRCNSKVSKHSCPTCGKKWRTSAELKTHIKTHSTLRPYMCEKCGQAYKHKHALEIHVGMHNGINPFKCSFCNKCFTQKGALMRHLPMHTGERPYQCELCGKRFIHHTSYNMHRLSHTGKKSYKCHVCDLSLLSTSHLKRHMRVHTGEKPYNCALCGKRFAERYNLLAHQKIHDPPEAKSRKIDKSQYKCDRCDLAFEERQSLMDHAKLHSDGNVKLDMKEFPIQSESTLEEAWVQVNRSKLNEIVLLQNPLSQIHEDSFAVAFTDDKISLENGNYNASLQVIIQSSDTSVLTNHVAVDSTQM